MIICPHLRRIAKESGRREITLSMVAEANEITRREERLKPLYHYPELVYWRCPSCGRVLSWERVSSCAPDLYCRCQMPKFMVMMQPLEVFKGFSGKVDQDWAEKEKAELAEFYGQR